MTKAKISQYDAVAANNTDVNGVNIAEGCPPSGMNNMGREIMAALKRFETGADGDSLTVGGALVVSGTATTNTLTAGPVSATTLNTSGAVVFNDAGADVDFRVEGDTNANLLFVDASTDRVGVCTSLPGVQLEVNGTIRTLRSGSTAAVVQLINDNNSWNITSGTSTAQFRIDNNLLGTALTINSSGTVGVNASLVTNTDNGGGGFTRSTGNSTELSTFGLVIQKYDNNTTTSNYFVRFDINAGSAYSGAIAANGAGAAAFISYSDERLKENIQDLEPQLNKILALCPVTFDYKKGGSNTGFIAQNVQTVYPDAVSADEDGYLTLGGFSKTEARLVKAIQELKAELDTVKSELATLKGQ